MERIKSIIGFDGSRILLEFSGGESMYVDLAEYAVQPGVFQNFSDEQFRRSARIMEHGLYLEWEGGLDIGADSLKRRAKMMVPSVE
jgi:hypothetical protein